GSAFRFLSPRWQRSKKNQKGRNGKKGSTDESHSYLAGSETSDLQVSQPSGHGWTRINADSKKSAFVSVLIRVHPWLYALRPRQFLDVDVLEPKLVAMVLQLDGAFRGQRFAGLPIVLQRSVINDHDVVQVDGHLVAL